LDNSTVRWPGQVRWAEPLPLPPTAQLTLAVSRTIDNDGHPVSLPHWERTSDMTPAAAVASYVNGYDTRLPKNLWLTAFEDKSSPRPGVADLYFDPAAQQTVLVPIVYWPEDRRVPIPVELVLVGAIAGINRFQKRRANKAVNQA
jgi:hypothetical protein